jgi:hypothetical protein
MTITRRLLTGLVLAAPAIARAQHLVAAVGGLGACG